MPSAFQVKGGFFTLQGFVLWFQEGQTIPLASAISPVVLIQSDQYAIAVHLGEAWPGSPH